MKIFAVDTSTSSCSVAIIKNQNILCEDSRTDGRTHSVNLMDMVSDLFDRSKLSPRDLFGFAVSVGPGTFTGLRIGISTVKGMAYSLGIPVVGINSLDALAFPLRNSNRPIVSMIDARRGEVYYACYNFNNGRISSSVIYNVASPEKVISEISSNTILVGSGAVVFASVFKDYCKTIKILQGDRYNRRKASSVAFLSVDKFIYGKLDKIDTVVPYYIRKSDVQINHSV